MRKRQLKRLWARLAKLATMKLSREALLMKLGAAQSQSPSVWRLVEVALDEQAPTFTYALRRNKLREALDKKLRQQDQLGPVMSSQSLSPHQPARNHVEKHHHSIVHVFRKS